MIRTVLAATALRCAMPAMAKTITVEVGADAQERSQKALVLAQPGDVAELGAGNYDLSGHNAGKM